jgi:hypothetical protein
MEIRRPTTANLRTAILPSTVALVSVLFFAPSSQAQMFGQRSLGQPLRPRPGAAAATTSETAGTLQGNERFMRENRSRNDFVGSNRTSQQGFVGSEQAIGSGRVPTAAESLPAIADESRRINRPHPRLGPNEIYHPYLTLELSESVPRSFQPTQPNAGDSTKFFLDNRLQQRIAADNPNVRILRNGGTAILFGTVSDLRQATQVSLLISFEPGIHTIQNQLQIVND